jgi:hypothetical protein
MTYSYEEKPSLEDLSHHGVKGMHWGVRKARTGNIDEQTKVLDRVAGGRGSTLDKVRVAGSSSVGRLVKSGGLKSEAARQSADLKAQRARLVAGKATMSDVLKAYGSVSVIDVLRSTRD